MNKFIYYEQIKWETQDESESHSHSCYRVTSEFRNWDREKRGTQIKN